MSFARTSRIAAIILPVCFDGILGDPFRRNVRKSNSAVFSGGGVIEGAASFHFSGSISRVAWQTGVFHNYRTEQGGETILLSPGLMLLSFLV